MKKKIIYSLLFVIGHQLIYAQYTKSLIPENIPAVGQATKSDMQITVVDKEIIPSSVDLQWQPLINHVRIHHRSRIPNEQLQLLKNEKLLLKKNQYISTEGFESINEETTVEPLLGRNFRGNANSGSSPMDNSIAISNGGKVISVANTTIEFYNQNGTRTYSNSIAAFFDDPTISDVCDPVVLYDSGADKFIFFAQECSGHSSNSYILICFSQTNDPNGNWWHYKLDGSVAGSNTWFDYPKLAVSNNELYIAGNAFTNDGDFQESVLYQIEKNDGYAGASIDWQYWNEITSSPFTLLPVSYGHQGNYGPGCYLVASDAVGGTTIDLYDLTGDISASNEQLLHYSIPTIPYSPAANGFQSGTSTGLDNGDCRSLSGFYLDGIIHFVFHGDYTNGYNGIIYNRLDVANISNTISTFGLEDYEYSYPAVASISDAEDDRSVMIGFGRTGENIYPEIRVVSCDHDWNWSPSVLVKSGNGFADFTASDGEAERWGDYTGISRKHNNTTPTIWISGMWGNSANEWDTWIAEITGAESTATHDMQKDDQHMEVYPNPVYNEFTTSFELDRNSAIEITLYDERGELVKHLGNQFAFAGKNIFSFNKSNLPAGMYSVILTSSQVIINHEKIIIAD